jgi:hypothetical protein
LRIFRLQQIWEPKKRTASCELQLVGSLDIVHFQGCHLGVGFHVSLVWGLPPPSTEACCDKAPKMGTVGEDPIESSFLSHQLILKFYPSNIVNYQFYISFI